MKNLILIISSLLLFGSTQCKNETRNSSDTNKDMYVIRATVYQVGIITNKTDDKNNTDTGKQEALTFFRTSGSNVDLGDIPAPLVTNVTAQSMIQVAPKNAETKIGQKSQINWSALKDLAALPQSSTPTKSENGGLKIVRRSNLPYHAGEVEYYDETPHESYQRAVSDFKSFKRDTAEDKGNVKVVKGVAVVPQSAGVQSIALPPLLTLNKNFSEIPVPIPNTSVVHYAKINTVVRKP